MKRIHLIGIGGIGMSGIAKLLLKLGFIVTGSDKQKNKSTEQLKLMGMTVYIGHHKDNIKHADLIVSSSAINESNPELQQAKKDKILAVSRADMLVELMKFTKNIVIAGTHGKTTTTSITADMLIHTKTKASFAIGGILKSMNTNAHLDNGKYFIAEADESDASFLKMHPFISVVTNIEAEHMKTYDYSLEKLKDSFIQYCNNTCVFGTVILCSDDKNVNDITEKINRKIITYGFNESADCRLISINKEKDAFNTKIQYKNKTFNINVPLPGRHNALNATAAFLISQELNIDAQKAISGIEKFQGVGRRFNITDKFQYLDYSCTLVDDYGHHPTEVKATISAVRDMWPQKQFILIFQPHRYSRTKDFFKEFAEALKLTDTTILLDVYSAGEQPIENINSKELAKNAGSNTIYTTKPLETLTQVINKDCIIITQGAGDITELNKEIQHHFNKVQLMEKEQ